MKNLTLVLVLSMAAFAGCKKKDDAGATAAGSGSDMAMGSGSAAPAMGSGSAAPAMGSGSAAPAMGSGSAVAMASGGGGACGSAFDHTMSLEKDLMKKEMPTMTDADFTKIRDTAVKHCNDDKWADEVVKCFGEGKTADEVEKCDEKLNKDQKDKFNKDMEATMASVMGAGSGSGGAPAAADLPKECADYKAAMDKLASCEKMPAATKDGLMQGFKAMSEGWANVANLPPEAVKAMTDGCKKSGDALTAAAKTICGW